MSSVELWLLRHAHAVNGSPDFERALSQDGQRQAEQAAKHIAGLPRAEEVRLLHSPARRTLETAGHVIRTLGLDTRSVMAEPDIYEASVGELLTVIEGHSDAPVIVLVGHNPAIEGLASHLCKQPIQMATASLVRLSKPAGDPWGTVPASFVAHQQFPVR